MNKLEQRLRFAMVPYVGGNRPAVSCDQVSVALASVGVLASAASVHLFAPEDFLVVFSRSEFRNRVTARPELFIAGAPLFFKQWNRQSQATHVSMSSKILLAVEGIPPHAWETEVVDYLLGKACVILEVAPETRSRADMSLFKLSSWTSDLESIPVARTLVVPEPVAAPPEGGLASASRVVEASGVVSLNYKVLVHVVAMEEEMSVEEHRRLQLPSDGHGRVAEEEAGGHDQRCWRPCPWRRGVPDQRGTSFGGARQASQLRSVLAPFPLTEWRLPAVSSPAPMIAAVSRIGQQPWSVEVLVVVDADKSAQRPVATKATLQTSSSIVSEIFPNNTVQTMQSSVVVEVEAIEVLPPMRIGNPMGADEAGIAADLMPFRTTIELEMPLSVQQS
jgi:hypothetical protein